MPLWGMPKKAKVYEALGAVADGRVRLSGPARAEVVSSTGERTYTVTWSDDGRVFSSNDNASYWQRSMGYPIIAVLLAAGRLAYDPALAAPLGGVAWKHLNEVFKRDYDKTVTAALRAAEERGADRAAIVEHAEAIYAQLEALGLERGPRGAPPERRSPPRPGTGAPRGAPVDGSAPSARKEK